MHITAALVRLAMSLISDSLGNKDLVFKCMKFRPLRLNCWNISSSASNVDGRGIVGPGLGLMSPLSLISLFASRNEAKLDLET